MVKNKNAKYNISRVGIIMSVIEMPNKTLGLRDDLLKLKEQWSRTTLLKALFFVATLVAGIAAIIFLGANFNFLAAGIGIILVSSFAIYQYFNCYRNSNNTFNRAADAIASNLTERT
jgi:hypothetical protein